MITQSNYQYSYGVKDTSLDVFVKLRDYLADSQIEIYKTIIEHPNSTRKEISRHAQKTTENTTGRVNDLMKLGLVCEGKRRECSITKNTAHEIYAIKHIDWNLLDIKKKQLNSNIKINKKHVATITYLLNFFKSRVGGSLEFLEQIGNSEEIKPFLELQEDLSDLFDKIQNETPFFYIDKGYSLIWKAKSENTDIFYTIEYIKSSRKISCTCKDFEFRHKKCKHIKKLSNKLKNMDIELDFKEVVK